MTTNLSSFTVFICLNKHGVAYGPAFTQKDSITATTKACKKSWEDLMKEGWICEQRYALKLEEMNKVGLQILEAPHER